MRSSSKLRWVRFNFRVNDLEFKEPLLRPCAEDPADFQLVVEHRFLGAFSLYEDFALEVRGFDGSATWRRIGLEELKLAFLEASLELSDLSAINLTSDYENWLAQSKAVAERLDNKKRPSVGGMQTRDVAGVR